MNKTKKSVKIYAIMMLIVLIIGVLQISIYAKTPDELIKKMGNAGTYENEDLTNAGEKIVGIIQTVGTIAAIAILSILGIKYMAGSMEERADIKKAMIPYIVGAILLFATTSIVSMIYSITKPKQSKMGEVAGKAGQQQEQKVDQ